MWQKGMDIAEATYILAEDLPSDERFGLRSQMTRAAVSIPLNIAEGSGRGTDKAYKQFLEYALGSAFELETLFLLLVKLKLDVKTDVDELIENVQEIQRMISGMIRRLK